MVFVENLRRPTALVVAVLFLVASVVPLLANRSVSAYTLLGDREIKISTSEGAATGVTYAVDFDVATTNDIGGIVVAFCDGASSPIIGDTDCVHPTGFDLTSAGLANGATGDVDVSSFTPAVTDHANGAGTNTFELTNSTAASGILVGDTVQFEITSVVNPSTIGTFYARIMTYDTEAEAQGYTLADEEAGGPVVEAGGIALSTADSLNVEARVQERLTFCVFTAELSVQGDYETCSHGSPTPIALGDENGVLSTIHPSISKDAKYNITTNAGQGAIVRVKGTTLTSGILTIDAAGDVTPGDGVAVISSEGTEQFGLCTYTDASSLNTNLSATAPYDDTDCNSTVAGQAANNDAGASFAFNDSEINSTYGDNVATKPAGDWSTGRLVFLGNVASITEPGIYVTTLDVIVTGRY